MTPSSVEGDPVRGRRRGSAAAEGAGEALARYYDLDLATEQDDVGLYLALASRLGGPILELAVGSGRVAVPIARAGYEVTGVDHDVHMLERARRRWEDARPGATSGAHRRKTTAGSLRLVETDITRLDLGERFALVILALNSILLLPGREAQAAAFRVAALHLAPGGRAVVDAWLPAPDDLALYDGRTVLEWVRTDSSARVAKLTSARHEPATGRATVTTFFDAWPADGGPVMRVAREDRLEFLSATELVAMAGSAGLAVETLGGDHGMAAFGPDSERAVLVCGLL